MTLRTVPARSRQRLKVRGVVQGVGFRPAVYRLATERALGGFVRNELDGVTIEIEGDDVAVAGFGEVLLALAPKAARISAIDAEPLPPVQERAFRVDASETSGAARTAIPADRATCDACIGELFDASDRRFRYPFITCTDCGPRYTIVCDVPYDRANTTMASFTMCSACRAEYDDPRDRRFHSETNCCPQCGPRLRGSIEDAVRVLRAGGIVAVKGIGGFHLAVDATNEAAVVRLRERKQRPHKPLAVMARDLETAKRHAVVDAAAATLLLGAGRPIVTLPKRGGLAGALAPQLSHAGVMLPYAPLHHLLLRDGPEMLVMTSGNRHDEPVAIDDEAALRQLAGIADSFLLHDRPIRERADDSVVRVVSGSVQPIRRSRGYVPEVIELPFDAPPVLGVGAELKNTVCFASGRSARLSAHIGDLSHPETIAFFEQSIEAVCGERPVALAHDLHPDFYSTRWALRSPLPRIGVQHHHAHIASCLAENGRTDRVLGIAFDGTGCGPEGELWGGEFLVCDLGSFTRVGHLRGIALPGGEAAIREPWRLAAAALVDAGESLDTLQRIEPRRMNAVRQLVERGTRAPLATSAGRWFDAVAALCGVRDEVTYEGQAAMELESIALPDGEPYAYDIDGASEIDLRAAVRAIAADVRAGVPPAVIAGRFHETLARSAFDVCSRLPLRTVALSGGCFQNVLFTGRLKELLEDGGFEVLVHHQVPPNDGGISLGQAAVAAWRLACV